MEYRNGVFFPFLLLPEGCSVKPRNAFCFPSFPVLIKVVMTCRLHLKGLFSPPIHISRSQVQSLSGIPVTQKIATFFGHLKKTTTNKDFYSCCHGSQHSPDSYPEGNYS